MLIRVMIVDDAEVVIQLLTKIVGKDSSIKLVSTAGNGQEAIQELERHLEIDIILLDIQMPIMNGLETIPHLLKIKPSLKIILMSSQAFTHSKHVLEGLSLGAADYIVKPDIKNIVEKVNLDIDDSLEDLKENRALEKFVTELLYKINIFGKQDLHVIPLVEKKNFYHFKPELIAIASSTGGPKALLEVLGGFSGDFLSKQIILITQHIQDDFIDLLINYLNSLETLHCKKAEDLEILKTGNVYFAPSSMHLEVIKNNQDLQIHLSDDLPENFCKPSADKMFDSIAHISDKAIAIILTGIGNDGLRGAKAMAAKGDIIIAQDKETSIVWGMPGAVSKSGICSAILPLEKIAPYIEKGCRA